MLTESFLSSEPLAPPPGWAVGASLALIAVFAALFVLTPAELRDETIADASASAALRP